MNATLPTRSIASKGLITCAGASVLFAGLSAYNLFHDFGPGCLGFGILAVALGWASLRPALRSSPNAGRGLVALLGLIIGVIALAAFGTLVLVGFTLQRLSGAPVN
jgi:hypothetical protein